MEKFIDGIQTRLGELAVQGTEMAIALCIALVLLLVTRKLAKWSSRWVRSTTAHRIRPTMQSLLIQITFVAIWIVGILIASVVAFPDLRLGDVIALLGLSSVAVGFAFQDIFKNFLAGVLLLLQEPFQIGDQIRVSSYEGTVEDIAIRSTQLRTYQGELIMIPNSIIFTSEIQVRTDRTTRRTDLSIGLDYKTPLPQAIALLTETAIGVEGVLPEPSVVVDVVSFGDSSIDLVVRYWTRSYQADVLRTQTRMIVALKQACDRAQLTIPYPIRTVYWYDQQQFQDTASRAQSSPSEMG